MESKKILLVLVHGNDVLYAIHIVWDDDCRTDSSSANWCHTFRILPLPVEFVLWFSHSSRGTWP